MKKLLTFIIILLILGLLGGGFYYWYYYVRTPAEVILDENGNPISSGFSPFNRPYTSTDSPAINTPVATTTQATSTEIVNEEAYVLPKLRQLSTTPVAGFYASSTASSSIVRFMDRGTGHIFEATTLSADIKKISNTTLPKIYESYGNKNGTAFVLRYLKTDSDTITNFYAELRSTGTSTIETPYELKGKYLSPDIQQIVVSPSGDRVFTWNIENGRGVGYVSSFNEATRVKVLDNPLTQVIVDWPEVNTATLATKATSFASGYIYTVNTQTGALKTVLGGIRGLTGKMSRDLSQVIYSSTSNGSLTTSLWNVKDSTSQPVIFKTLSDKCVWSTLRKNEVYCAVPVEIPNATYPDDWYKGNISFNDQIWHLNTTTGEVHLLGNLTSLSSQAIDAIDLTLDPQEDSLYFMNKRDLTLWGLDLNQ